MSSFSTQMLGPIVGLNLWTFVIEGWMYATRIPATVRAQKTGKLTMRPDMTKEEYNGALPANVRWKADNYNHLMEQPLQFYAIALVVAQLGRGNKVDLGLAWAYVGIRVVHSLVQCLSNKIPTRFGIFLASSGVLAALTVRAGIAVFGA
ncbi:hypothetical protein TWF569_003546 [Orbilia oligospora]|uniref:Uncharacterized protein n=1 Tax=Orbilia oligospora TaxID=2813651 RepID=A0A7C8P8I6_ORBOL|nr:hypothetical protein TWF102_008674 [Orbilia oligospora]KAF3100582.1 hypothetical protein TWF706_006137 [Orbilia oligospora]KAF3101415.1 hypothetical protein TWF103_007984 [Orbilia oligospora]KAF3124905.1 hypothetical protein TWF594_001753 [Orbilia oligospora]KAF3151832.1 hypothetical protein TWF569_003546 [Orbilia oligospora]